MFYNIPYEHLGSIRIDEIKTHSFISKEVRLLSYVKDRNIVNIDKAEMDFSLYKKDLIERYMRIPRLQALYEKKLTKLRAFQNGKDIWKTVCQEEEPTSEREPTDAGRAATT